MPQRQKSASRRGGARATAISMMAASTEAAQGITYAERGMGVDVQMNDEWLPVTAPPPLSFYLVRCILSSLHQVLGSCCCCCCLCCC